MRLRLLTCAVIVALSAMACGADNATTVTEPASTGTDVAVSGASSATGDVPDLDMVSVYTGETVNLQSLVNGETPLLLWFWAPH